MNGWVFAKGGLTTLGYLNRANIPFQYALADAYTVGDAYHCSVLSATGPNRTGHGEGKYDLTVVGPNRFLRHFTGAVSAAGATAQVSAAYHQGGFGLRPRLVLSLINSGRATVTFTVTVNNYGKDRLRTYRVPAHGRAVHEADPLVSSGGWYDLSVTVGGDGSWSRRYTGHLEDGRNSVTG